MARGGRALCSRRRAAAGRRPPARGPCAAPRRARVHEHRRRVPRAHEGRALGGERCIVDGHARAAGGRRSGAARAAGGRAGGSSTQLACRVAACAAQQSGSPQCAESTPPGAPDHGQRVHRGQAKHLDRAVVVAHKQARVAAGRAPDVQRVVNAAALAADVALKQRAAAAAHRAHLQLRGDGGSRARVVGQAAGRLSRTNQGTYPRAPPPQTNAQTNVSSPPRCAGRLPRGTRGRRSCCWAQNSAPWPSRPGGDLRVVGGAV